MNSVIERMRSGKRISETASDFPAFCEEIEKTRKLIAELNTGYHTPDEIRSLLERISSGAAAGFERKDVPALLHGFRKTDPRG